MRKVSAIWAAVATLLLLGFILYSLIRIMIYAKEVIRPNFCPVGKTIKERSSFNSKWHSTFGKTANYTLPTFSIAVVAMDYKNFNGKLNGPPCLGE